MLKPDQKPLRRNISQMRTSFTSASYSYFSPKDRSRCLEHTLRQAAGSQTVWDKGMNFPFPQLQTLALPPSDPLES